MVLIDSVALGHPLVANGSFENPDVSSEPGGYQYNPTDPTWTFVGDAGLASNGSDLTLGNPNAPDGSQVAFVQNAGYMFQVRNVAAGTYALHFQAAQREGNTRNQEVRVNLRPSGAGISVKRFVWCGSQICEERDSSGLTVTKRFFPEGEQRIGGSDAGNYYYSRDHLGSIREVTDASGALKARYDYDPYGKSVVVDGNMNVDFGYTGHYFHAPSGLNLTLYRAYNPALGRWMSRDPLIDAETTQGPNLYHYASNNPINESDPLGLLSPRAQAYVDAAMQISNNNLTLTWFFLRCQREGAELNLALRDAEHWALAAALARNYGHLAFPVEGAVIPVWTGSKVPAYLMNSSTPDTSPPSWTEIEAGYEGAVYGYIGYLLYGPQWTW